MHTWHCPAHGRQYRRYQKGQAIKISKEEHEAQTAVNHEHVLEVKVSGVRAEMRRRPSGGFVVEVGPENFEGAKLCPELWQLLLMLTRYDQALGVMAGQVHRGELAEADLKSFDNMFSDIKEAAAYLNEQAMPLLAMYDIKEIKDE